MPFRFHQQLVDEDGETNEGAASRYVEQLALLFAESPEGAALRAQGIEPGGYLEMFLDYALRYVGTNPAEMDASDVRETLDVFAEKVTGKPEDLDQVIPELEAYCDFVQRAFGLARAATWKREIQRQAGSFRRNVRDPRRWGMAKSMMMEGMARGFDLSTEQGINQWMQTLQAERLAQAARQQPETGTPGSIGDRIRQVLGLSASGAAPAEDGPEDVPAARGLGGRHPSGPFDLGSAPGARRGKAKEKAKRKLRQSSRRRNRR